MSIFDHPEYDQHGVNMTTRRFRILMLLGALLTLLGGAFIGMYIWEAIIVRIGEPDQSLLFWYLPILFIGLFISLGGLVLLIFTIYSVRRKDSTTERAS